MTAATPSRDSQEERHCEKARQARSGWPRWKVDDNKPMVMRPSATTIAVSPNASDEASPWLMPTRLSSARRP